MTIAQLHDRFETHRLPEPRDDSADAPVWRLDAPTTPDPSTTAPPVMRTHAPSPGPLELPEPPPAPPAPSLLWALAWVGVGAAVGLPVAGALVLLALSL